SGGGSNRADQSQTGKRSIPEGDRMSGILLPMLATRAAPFDSDAYLFEVKWDGVRALAAIENRRWRLLGRNGSDYTERYPELAVLRCLPSGTIIDGDLIVLQNGRV